MCELVAQVDYHRKTLDKVSFRVHLDYLIDQILGEVFFFEDIEPIIPLLVACLEDNEDETQEDEALKRQAMGMFFKLFGMHDSKEIANKIEKLLLNENKLYPIFFKKIKTKLIQKEDQRPKTTNPDFNSVPWSNEKNYQENKKDSEDEDDDFPLNNNYKLIESRPKTSCGLMINTKEDDEDAYRKDINFDLSPSQTDANEQECSFHQKSSHISQTISSKEDPQLLGQFLTEEKQFTSLPSIISSHDQKVSIDLLSSNAQPSPKVNPSQSTAVVKEVDEEVLKKKIEEEKDLINREWQERVAEKEREHQNEIRTYKQLNDQYVKDSDELQRLKQQYDEMRELNQNLMEKYEKALNEKIENAKRMDEELQRTVENQSQKSDMRIYAEQNISNPIDLSMSIVLSNGMPPTHAEPITINPSKVSQLSEIFHQKSIRNSDDSEEEEEVVRESVFKLQTYLIETENADDITKPILM